MGVSGSGKSTVAAALSQSLGWILAEGDDFHSPANIAKMHSGTPLGDDDRMPWLRAIAAWIDARRQAGESAIVTCSALKRAYRDLLAAGRPEVLFVYLKGTADVMSRHLAGREGHFMPASLLASQFETLEEPTAGEPVLAVDAARPVGEIVSGIEVGLQAVTQPKRPVT
jgi:carbohydrate kinase (thermoresistant glucokinase family)